MTVKEAVNVLKQAQKITIGYGANLIPCNVQDPVVLAAFADYVVDTINGVGEEEYEINLAIAPVKEGVNA